MHWTLALLALSCVGCKQPPATETHAEVQEPALDAAAVAQLTVDVRADGTLALDGRSVKDENELTERTRDTARDKPVLHAVIHVDKGTSYDRVVTAMDALKRGGVIHMTFAVDGAKDAAVQ